MYGPTTVYPSISSLLVTCEPSSPLFSPPLQHFFFAIHPTKQKNSSSHIHPTKHVIWIMDNHNQKSMDTHIPFNIVLESNASLLYLLLGTAAFRTIPFGVVRTYPSCTGGMSTTRRSSGRITGAPAAVAHVGALAGGATVQHREIRSNFRDTKVLSIFQI